MSSLTGHWQANLRDFLQELGEEKTKAILSSFSCPLNEDVESFLHNKAIQFAKMGIAATHLVFASYKSKTVLVGYYSLANKTVSIKSAVLSANYRRRLKKFAFIDNETKRYVLSLPLIGQLGKNFTNGYDKLISGDELLALACQRVQDAQSLIGGKAVYLECVDSPRLIEFYERNGFSRFANRNLDKDELQIGEKQYLVQMLKYFGEN